MRFFLFVYILLIANVSFSQEAQKDTISVALDTLPLIPLEPKSTDTILRITNLNPFFTLQVDSTLVYDLEINKPPHHFFWFLKNAPIGVKIDKNTPIEKALKQLKNKVIKTRQSQELINRKTFVKKSELIDCITKYLLLDDVFSLNI